LYHQVAEIKGLENFSLWQKLSSFQKTYNNFTVEFLRRRYWKIWKNNF